MFIFKLCALFSLIFAVWAKLDHPAINPPFPGGMSALGQGLLDHASPPPSRSEPWPQGWIPQDVKDRAVAENLSATDIETTNVYYADCDTPWIISRHKNAALNFAQMVQYFGIIPVRMRQTVRHILAVPDNGTSAYYLAGNIVLKGTVGPTAVVHETGHGVDSLAFDASLGKPFSSGKTWLDAYNADTAVPGDYAQTNQQENFAENTVVALFDYTWPSQLPKIQPSWKTIQHQYTTIQQQLGENIHRDGKCTARLPNSQSVPIGNSRKTRRETLGSRPDVSLKGNVSVFDTSFLPTTASVASFDAYGELVGTTSVSL